MILVTGASGYLGKHVVARLNETGADYAGVNSHWDLTKPEVVAELMRAIRPDSIIHTSAIVPKTAAGYHDGKAATDSVAMVRNLAKHAECPITFASSMTAAHATTEYAYGKLQAERVLEARKYDGDQVIRLPGLFGAPRQSGVLYNAARAFLTGQPFVLDAIPTQWAAMDVRDAAECMVTGVYDGPTGTMDIRAAIALVGYHCGVDWEAITGRHSLRFFRRIAELVESVRADLKAAA